jgi:hypothetical protein
MATTLSVQIPCIIVEINSAKVAVPVGTSALVENSAQVKARCAEVTFNAKKPVKFAIRL